MKNAFLISTLIITAGFFAVVAATTLGFVSANLPGIPAIVGTYAALGVLAFAIRDYAPQPAANAARRTTRQAPRAKVRPAVYAPSLSNPTLHAN